MQRRLISFQRQGIIAALIDDLLRDGALAIKRIDRDDGAFQRQHRKQFWHRGDLVRLRIRSDLAKHHALLASPGADHMQR